FVARKVVFLAAGVYIVHAIIVIVHPKNERALRTRTVQSAKGEIHGSIMVSIQAQMNHIDNGMTDFGGFDVRLGGENDAARLGEEEFAVFGENAGFVGRGVAVGIGLVGFVEELFEVGKLVRVPVQDALLGPAGE